MEDKSVYLKRIEDCGVVAVIRGKTTENAIKTADACIKGGVKIIELTFSTPEVEKAISVTCEKYKDDNSVVVGAGTVMSKEDARKGPVAGPPSPFKAAVGRFRLAGL